MTPALARDLLVAAVWTTLVTLTAGAAGFATYWTSLDGDYALIAGGATAALWVYVAAAVAMCQSKRRQGRHD